MKKKKQPVADNPVVPHEILEQAKRAADTDRLRRRPGRCVVCGTETAPNSSEGLCWVCRRLKISAWRDSDFQASAPE